MLLYTARIAGPAGVLEYDRIGRIVQAATARWAWPGPLDPRRAIARTTRTRPSRPSPFTTSTAVAQAFTSTFEDVTVLQRSGAPSTALALHPATRHGRASTSVGIAATPTEKIRMNLTVVPYSPSQLDTELARLAYQCIRTWPDQQPVSAILVEARLTPHQPDVPTMLAVIRDSTGRLTGAAALRPGAGPRDRTRLWGPLVHPDHQRRGHGTALLKALLPHLPEGTALTSAEVPADRGAATGFFAHATWQLLGDAALFKLPLDTPLPLDQLPDGFTVRSARHGEDLAAPLENLFAACRPHLGAEAAAGAFARWSSDRRFRTSCLVLLESGTTLRGAALAYPLAHPDGEELPEALLADLLVDPGLGRTAAAAVRDYLAAEALNQARVRGGRMARAVVPETDTATRACLHRLGFATTASLLYFAPPATTPATAEAAPGSLAGERLEAR